MSEARRSDPSPAYRQPTPCERCGYLYDHGTHGARLCPQCARQDLTDLDAFAAEMRPKLREQLASEAHLAAAFDAFCRSRQRTPIH